MTDPAEARQELAGLAVQVLAVAGDVAVLVGLDVLPVITLGVQPVDRKLGMVPIYEGVVETYLHALGAERLDHRGDEVLAPGRVGHLVIREIRVPEAEAVVMLGRDDEVPHARVPRLSGPLFGAVEVGVEVVEVPLVVLVANPLALLDPFVARGGRRSPSG